MNLHSEINDDNNKDRTKATAPIPMVGAIVTAALLLSGLALISSYQQPVIAQQQNMTGGGGGRVTEGGATITDNTTSITGSTGTQGGNATSTGAAGGNQSEVRFHVEEARTALQNNDTQGAMMHLDLALNTLGGAGGTQGNVTTGTTIAGTDNADESSSGDANRRETDTGEEGD